MQPLDILFDCVDELRLVLLDGSTDLRDHLATQRRVADFGLSPSDEQKER